MRSNDSLEVMSHPQLLRRFDDLVRKDRRCTADMLAAIAEIDRRKLWAEHACPSMFAFCVERFHMSESVTAKRIWAARTARRFPVILEMVARGELHLSAIQQLAKHLTEDNHRALLERAKHKSSRQIDLLVAEIAPKPDVPSRLRALPRRRASHLPASQGSGLPSESGGPSGSRVPSELGVSSESGGHSEPGVSSGAGGDSGSRVQPGSGVHGNPSVDGNEDGEDSTAPVERAAAQTATSLPPATSATSRDGSSPAGTSTASASPKASDTPNNSRPGASSTTNPTNKKNTPIVALSPRRYKLEITVDQQTHDKLRMLQDLLGQKAAGADPAVIVSRAVDLLLTDTLKRKAGLTARPRCSGGRRKGESARRTRAIPAAVRRQVWARDEGRCAFVDERGRRCRGTRAVQFHHLHPYAKGGQHEANNIALRCPAHNQFQADLDFGATFMDRKRRDRVGHDRGSHDQERHRDIPRGMLGAVSGGG